MPVGMFFWFFNNQFEIFALLLNLHQCDTFSKIALFIFYFLLFVAANFFSTKINLI